MSRTLSGHMVRSSVVLPRIPLCWNFGYAPPSRLNTMASWNSAALGSRVKHVTRANILLNGFGDALDRDPRYAAAVATNNLPALEEIVRAKALETRAVMMQDASNESP